MWHTYITKNRYAKPHNITAKVCCQAEQYVDGLRYVTIKYVDFRWNVYTVIDKQLHKYQYCHGEDDEIASVCYIPSSRAAYQPGAYHGPCSVWKKWLAIGDWKKTRYKQAAWCEPRNPVLNPIFIRFICCKLAGVCVRTLEFIFQIILVGWACDARN